MKLVFLRLVGIRYEGDTIGDDITIDIRAGDAAFSANKKLSQGATASIDTVVADFTVAEGPFSLPITVSVIERDPVYNDVGSNSGRFSIDLGSAARQSFQQKVIVKEDGAWGKHGTAVFTLDFAADVAEAVRYVPPTEDGFLVVLEEPGRKRFSLPETTAVQVERIAGGREYFLILEGHMQGKRASVSLEKDKRSRLSGANPRQPPVRLDFSLSKKILSVHEGYPAYSAVSDEEPVRPGLYDLEIPDAPHRGGLNYDGVAHARVWFRIGHEGNRYLHTGSMSTGCVTVLETDRWEELYRSLIAARKGDGISVGTIRVVE